MPANEHLDADVCIVGAGAAGLTLALELLATGARVCILESGGNGPGQVDPRLLGGESVAYPYASFDRVNTRGLGGTTHEWQFWHACPLDRIDFEERSGVQASGWPFDRDALVPFYRRAERICGAAPFAYEEEPETLDGIARQWPFGSGPLALRSLQVLTSGFGEHVERVSGSSEVRVLLHATATQLVTDNGDGRVTGIEASAGTERKLSVQARVYVLAAGGIEVPRLLLLSDRTHTAGLGNQHDLVGRYFMEHPAARSGVIVPSGRQLLEERSLYLRPGTLYTESDRAAAAVRPLIALDERTLRDEELLNVAFLLEGQTRSFACNGTRSLATLARAVSSRPRPPDLVRHGVAALRDAPSISRALGGARLGRRPVEPEVLVMRVQAEQQPSRESRITLGNQRDALGLRQPRLEWRLSPRETESIRRAQDLVDGELRAASLGVVEDKLGQENPPALFYGLHHHLGTARMHRDPKQGVVDADCRVHGTSNLFVAGGAVFPTSGWANPSLTIVALAVRLADHLKRDHGLR